MTQKRLRSGSGTPRDASVCCRTRQREHRDDLIRPHRKQPREVGVAVEPLEVYQNHGRPEPRLGRDDGGHAERVFTRLADLEIALDAVVCDW